MPADIGNGPAMTRGTQPETGSPGLDAPSLDDSAAEVALGPLVAMVTLLRLPALRAALPLPSRVPLRMPAVPSFPARVSVQLTPRFN